MRVFLVSLVMFGFALAAGAQDEYKRAMDLMKRGSYQDALVLLEESVQAHPDWYYPILLKGQCNQKLGKFEEALRNYNDTLTLEVDSKEIPQIKNAIARCYMDLKQFEKARQAYTDVLAMAPDTRKFDVLINRGQCEMQIAKASESSNKSKAQEFYSKSIVTFTDALKYPTKNPDLQIEASFQKAYAQYKIGNLTGGIKSLQDGIKAFQEVISRNPKEQRAHKFIVSLQLEIIEGTKGDNKVKEYNELVTYVDRYLALWPKDDEMLNKKGLALQGAKKFKEAINAFQLLATSKPKDGSIQFSIGSCQMADKQYAAAIASLEKARANGYKTDPRVYTFAASCYAKQKTKCYSTDAALDKSAIAILDQGLKSLSGAAKEAVQKERDLKAENLRILEENLATDNANHQTTISNIRSLSEGLSKNLAILQKNRDLLLQTPTEELRQAVAKGQTAVDADKAKLEKEYANLKNYIAEASKCGNDKSLVHLAEMQELMKLKK